MNYSSNNSTPFQGCIYLFSMTIPMFAAAIALLFGVNTLFILLPEIISSKVIRVVLSILIYGIALQASIGAADVICDKIVQNFKQMALSRLVEIRIVFLVCSINVILTLWALFSIQGETTFGSAIIFLTGIFSIPSLGKIVIEKVVGKPLGEYFN